MRNEITIQYITLRDETKTVLRYTFLHDFDREKGFESHNGSFFGLWSRILDGYSKLKY